MFIIRIDDAVLDQDPNLRPTFHEITQRLRILTEKLPGVNFGDKEREEVSTPEGNVVFVQSAIRDANHFWNNLPNQMVEAIGIIIMIKKENDKRI